MRNAFGVSRVLWQLLMMKERPRLLFKTRPKVGGVSRFRSVEDLDADVFPGDIVRSGTFADTVHLQADEAFRMCLVDAGVGQFFDLPAGLTLSTADQVRFGQGDFPTDASPWSAAGCCQGPPQALIFEEAGADEALSEIVLGSEQPSGGLGDFNAFTAGGGQNDDADALHFLLVKTRTLF